MNARDRRRAKRWARAYALVDVLKDFVFAKNRDDAAVAIYRAFEREAQIALRGRRP